jgi:hypothetical protein
VLEADAREMVREGATSLYRERLRQRMGYEADFKRDHLNGTGTPSRCPPPKEVDRAVFLPSEFLLFEVRYPPSLDLPGFQHLLEGNCVAYDSHDALLCWRKVENGQLAKTPFSREERERPPILPRGS